MLLATLVIVWDSIFLLDFSPLAYSGRGGIICWEAPSRLVGETTIELDMGILACWKRG
jgi:hypothetical protein